MGLGTKNGESNKMNKFLTEILEQPKSLKDTLDYYSCAEGESVLKEIGDLYKNGNFREIIFTGMGSSFFVSHAAACLFNSLGINAYAVNTNELLYYNMSLIAEDKLVVCISQSGESIEVVKLLDILPAGVSCIGVSNEENSSLSNNAKCVLLSRAGKEEMTSTKTYTSMIMVLYMLGWYLAGKLDGEKIDELKKLVREFEDTLNEYANKITGEISFFGEIDFLQFIGRGPSYASAQQSELMCKEAVKLAAAGTLGGEFRHGPMEMVKPGFKAVLFAADGKTYDQSIKMAADIVKYQGKVLVLTNKKPELNHPNANIIVFHQPDEFLFAIVNIIPMQLIVNELALAKGLVPGDFINGGKVTLSE